MSELVDAKGLACPEPVILAKKALDAHDQVTVLVDNATALENVRRLASVSGCAVDVTEDPAGIFRIDIRKGKAGASTTSSECAHTDVAPQASAGPAICVIASSAMGCGNDELGEMLMKAFIHTVAELTRLPNVMIFYNTGVKLASLDSAALDDLRALEEKGVKLLLCGTCVNFFSLSGKTGVGTISNMYDIAGALSTAGRIIRP